ncbi:MAG: hypothetical protein Kow0031_34380 [Anaerolineae bacterium]
MLPRWLIKVAFHLLYHQLAFTYDAVAWLVSLGQWPAWRRLSLQFVGDGPILELAYGTGGLFADMQRVGHRPVGIDLSPFMARLASRRLRRLGLPLPLSRARAQQLPFPAGHFGSVIATFPTPYIFEPETLAEVARVLRSEGRLIVVMEGHLLAPAPLRRLIDWLYQITAQRDFSDAAPLRRFEQAGLTAEWRTVSLNGASAKLLIAAKNSPR